MKLIDCKIDKAVLIRAKEDLTEQRVLGKLPPRWYGPDEVFKIAPAPANLRDGTIEYAVYIKKRAPRKVKGVVDSVLPEPNNFSMTEYVCKQTSTTNKNE